MQLESDAKPNPVRFECDLDYIPVGDWSTAPGSCVCRISCFLLSWRSFRAPSGRAPVGIYW